MLLPAINWLAVGVCLLVGVVSGSLWYNPKTFFPMWWRAIGKSDQEQPGAGQNMGLVFGLTFVATLVQAIGMAILLGLVYADGYTVTQAVLLGALLWAGVIGPTSLVNKLFAGHHLSAWLIESGNHLLNFCLFGVILGIFAQ